MNLALLAHHADDQPVAYGNAGARTAHDLLADAARIAAVLPEATPGSQVLFVVRHDHYALACALVAVMVRGHALALPPETGRESITAIADDPRTALIAHDTPSSIGVKLDQLLAAGQGAPPAPITRAQLAEAVLRVRLFARGEQDGLDQRPRSDDAWLREASALGRALRLGPGARVASTLMPGQPYAIVAGVLMPLLYGAAFARDVLPLRSLAQRVPELAPSLLVSVPSHLRSLMGAAGALSSVKHVLSALAPLTAELADEVHGAGCALTDLLYAAHAGPVALREAADAPGFTALPEVAVALSDHALQVAAPWLDRATALADRARLTGNAITLFGHARDAFPLGRGELQASELEAFLERLPGVEDACVVVAPPAEARPTRLLAAAVYPEGARPRLEAAIAERFGGLAIPECLLRVGSVKRDSTGRTTRADVLRLFRLRPDGSALHFALGPSELLPPVASEPRTRRFRLHIPRDYAYYDGHFAGYPILAGAVQLSELVLPCVRRVAPELGMLSQVLRLKFTGRIKPGDDIDAELGLRDDGAHVDFTLRRGTSVCASGTLQFVPEAATP